MVVVSCSSKEKKTGNAYKKKVPMWGASWRAVSLWPRDDCSELHSPGSLQQAEEGPCCMGWPTDAVKSPLGSDVQMVLFWAPVCQPEPRWELQLQGAVTDNQGERASRKPGEKCGRDSSPELILLVVLSVLHKTAMKLKAKHGLSSCNTSFLDSGSCAFSALTWLFTSPAAS